MRNGRAGQAPVEAVLGTVVMVGLLLFALEFGRHSYARFAVRNHVAQAATLAASGRTLVDPESGEPMTRAESVVYLIESSVGSTPVELESVAIDPADGGGPGDLVQISARYKFDFLAGPLVQPFVPGSLIFTVTSVVKNAPGS
jgi:hypothetical protein